jgi:membrane peptidoglycan carboxypeptidase
MHRQPVSLLINRRLHYRIQRLHRPGRRLKQMLLGFTAFVGIVLAVVLLFTGVLYANLTENLPSLNTFPVLLDSVDGQLLQPTRLYDRTGEKVLLTLENPGIPRRYLPLDPQLPDHLSPQLVQVTLSLLQPDYWYSPGFSIGHLFDSAPVTIAERLVSELMLENEQPGLRRALRMRLLASQIVAKFGRTRVLEWYLNSTSYGHLAYGADSAAQLYIGKPASQLNLAESTLLVAVAEAPALNPLDAPAAAIERQQQMLDRLHNSGVIGEAEYLQARQIPLKIQSAPGSPEEISRAFNRIVVDQLSARFGRQRVERGGLRVITSLDVESQLQMTCTLQTQINRLGGKIQPTDLPDESACDSARLLPTLPPGTGMLAEDLAGSSVLLDVKSGQILGMVGELSSKGERVLPRRPPGSTLTPFVALAAFARGMGPASLVWDIPASLPETLADQNNPDGIYHGPQRLRLALANDYLVPINQLLVQLGSANVWRQAENFGLTGLKSDKPEDLLFDGGSVTPLDLAEAYSIIANQGLKIGTPLGLGTQLGPTAVITIEDAGGKILLDQQLPQEQSILSQQLAYLIHNVLSDETARWPGLGYPNSLEIGRPAGAKIGSAAQGQDAWAVGYTPKLLAVVWLGLPDSKDTKMTLDPKMAAGIWHALMQYATRAQPAGDWPVPSGIIQREVCDPSGKLLTPDCPTPVRETFLTGNEPTDYDTLYQKVQVNRETGRLATVFTPLELIEEKTFLVVPSNAQEWAKTSGLAVPPTVYDAIQAPQPKPDVRIDQPALFAYIHGKVNVQGTAAGEGFTSFRLQVGKGLNPRSWAQVGSETNTSIQNGVLAEWDTTTEKDGLYAVRLIVLHQDQRLDTAIIQVTVDNTPPQVNIPFPQNGQQVQSAAGGGIVLRADVKDAIHVDRVEWYLDDNKLGETRQPPYIYNWQGVIGDHALQVKAFDLAGNVAVSEKISFKVIP